MSHALRSLPSILIVGILFAAGCGENQDERPRFNENLGDSPVGAPIGAGPIDNGILQDQTNYRPAPFEPLEGEPAAAGDDGEGDGEAGAAQAAINDLIDSVFEADIDTILDAFVPEQIAALREDPCMTTIYDATDALEAFMETVREKGTGPEFEASNELWDALPLLAEPLKRVFSVTMLDEENAVATLAISKLEIPDEFAEVFSKAMTQSMAMGAGMMGAGAAPPDAAAGKPTATGAGMPPGGMSPDALLAMTGDVEIPLPMKKVDDEWRLVLPFSFTTEQAELISEGLEIVNETLGTTTQQIDELETLDAPTYTQILMQAQGSALPQLMGWFARAQVTFGSLMESGPGAMGEETPADEDASKPADAGATDAPDEPNKP